MSARETLLAEQLHDALGRAAAAEAERDEVRAERDALLAADSDNWDRAEAAEAERDELREQVQRVREVCDNEDYGRIFAEYGRDAELIRVVPLSAILRALGDACPTCSWPIRETVGMVCQTCGTDYGSGGDE